MTEKGVAARAVDRAAVASSVAASVATSVPAKSKKKKKTREAKTYTRVLDTDLDVATCSAAALAPSYNALDRELQVRSSAKGMLLRWCGRFLVLW